MSHRIASLLRAEQSDDVQPECLMKSGRRSDRLEFVRKRNTIYFIIPKYTASSTVVLLTTHPPIQFAPCLPILQPRFSFFAVPVRSLNARSSACIKLLLEISVIYVRACCWKRERESERVRVRANYGGALQRVERRPCLANPHQKAILLNVTWCAFFYFAFLLAEWEPGYEEKLAVVICWRVCMDERAWNLQKKISNEWHSTMD